MFELIVLNGDYGYEDYRVRDVQSVTIDASDARWTLANMGEPTNRYPVLIDDSARVLLIGGQIDGEVPLDLDWSDAYVNSAAVFLRDTPDSTVRGWRISRAWDGVRVHGENFRIEQVWMSEIRDDAVENDIGHGGTVSDSLFDGVFVGLSSHDRNTPDATGNVVRIENVLIRMEPYLYRGAITHGPVFKLSDPSPKMEITGSILAIQDVDHFGQKRMAMAWDKMLSASGNFFLNLSDEPLPPDYPLPPQGFTVMQGEEARAFWGLARDGWVDRWHSGPGR